MAIHANSTPAPERTLLRETAAPGRLLPAAQPSPAQRADLLAIMAMAPDMVEVARLRRPAMGDAIHALIEAMDALDADPDLEDDGSDEPYMSRCETDHRQPEYQGYGADECEDGHDHEPSLGAPEVEFDIGSRRIVRRGHVDQRRWSDGGSGHDDGEPTLGSREGSGADNRWPGQLAWSAGYQRNPLYDECEPVSEDEGGCIQSQPHDEYEQDREPALGALEHVNQTCWGGSDSMYSDESEDSLGAPENPHDQREWSQGKGSVELDHDEHCGLRSWGTYNEARLRTERIRKDTEAMLRRKRLIRTDMDELRIVMPGIAEFRGARL